MEHFAWPLATLIFTITFLVLFRAQISALIPKIKRVGKDGFVAVDDSNQQRVTLDAARTRELFRMYQRSLAYAISRVIDDTLADVLRNPKCYNRDLFIERIWREILKCREEVLHFHNPVLGSIHEYFGRFTLAQLTRLIIDRYEPMLLSHDIDPIDRRRNLFDSVEIIQASFRDEAIRTLENSSGHNQS